MSEVVHLLVQLVYTGLKIKNISWSHFYDGCNILVAKLKTVNHKIATTVEVLVTKGNI